jgi:hypothetical protein
MYGNSKVVSMHDGYEGYAGITGEDKSAYCWAHVLGLPMRSQYLRRSQQQLPARFGIDSSLSIKLSEPIQAGQKNRKGQHLKKS